MDQEAVTEKLYNWPVDETIERLHKVIEGQGLSMAAMTKELNKARVRVKEGKARATALEEAAQIADQHLSHIRLCDKAETCAVAIAAEIRALAKPREP